MLVLVKISVNFSSSKWMMDDILKTDFKDLSLSEILTGLSDIFIVM